jgi:hypothetical protein
MRTILILIAALLTSSAHAATPAEQACVLKAADTLPKIQGMKIGKGRASTAEGAPPGFLRVDIDWEAAASARRGSISALWMAMATLGCNAWLSRAFPLHSVAGLLPEGIEIGAQFRVYAIFTKHL